MRLIVGLVAVLVVGAVIALSNTFYMVREYEHAIVLQFGEPVGRAEGAGLHFKVPFVQQVVLIDSRILDLDTEPERVLSNEQRPILIDAFVRWRVSDPLLYYQTLRDEFGANQTLRNTLRSNLRAVVGAEPFGALLTVERTVLMLETRNRMNLEAVNYGVEIVDVRILRADLPDEIEERVFERMRTERQALAREIEARGEAEATRIRSRAERTVTVTLANAERQAQITRGEGDAERNRIFAEAYGRDPEFFSFYRSMLAYENALGADETRMVLSPDSEFFRYFADPSGGE